jgi:hypothetical protein
MQILRFLMLALVSYRNNSDSIFGSSLGNTEKL